MTRVDFYVVDEGAGLDRFRLTCRIAEKAWASGHRVLIHTGNETDARQMNELLWTFRDRSFVPHGLLGESDPSGTPVLVGHGTDAGGEHDVLINLADTVPAFFSSFERVIETVGGDPGSRVASRERYRFYRDRGYPLNNQRIAR